MKHATMPMLTTGLLLLVASNPAAADTWPLYSEIEPALSNYEATYPDLAKMYDLGLTADTTANPRRHIWAIRISDNVLVEEDEPEFKYISTMHGDEIVGVKMCMNLISHLLTNYGIDPRVTNIVDETELWIVPLMNPDGYDRSPRTRENYNGVDLNRNFPEGSGPSPDPNTTTGRAIETANIMNWSFGRSFTASANFHGGALVVNYAFDNDNMGSVFSPTPDEDFFVWMSEQYSYYNTPMWNSATFFHGITNGAEWYAIDGGMQDWNYRYMGCNEVTIELGESKQPPASQIPTLWSQNRDSMLTYIETCLTGVRGLVTDAGSGLPVFATITVAGRDHDIYTDPDVGDYHRLLRPGTYDLTFTAGGYDPLTVSNVVVSSGPATRLDVQLAGPPVMAFPNGGEELPAGAQTNVTWTGSSTAQFHVQYTENYGDFSTASDNFERATLGPDYTTGGNANWFITTSSYHSATRSARAGAINHSQSTWMKRTVSGGAMSFWYRVSSENNYDWFNFYVDGVQQLHRSGTVAWTQYSAVLPPGSHELKWEYVKDGGVIGGSDTAWVDDLQITVDNTVWSDIVALTGPGVHTAPWTPANLGTNYKTRVRVYYGGSSYGAWDESDGTFSVVQAACNPADLDGDVNEDLSVDGLDVGTYVTAVLGTPTQSQICHGDFNGSDTLDPGDTPGFVNALLAAP